MTDLNVYGPFLSKKLAAHKGLKQFFEGKECKRGHIDARQLANGRCMECQRQRKLELYYNPELGKGVRAPRVLVHKRTSDRVTRLVAPNFTEIAERGQFIYAYLSKRTLKPWYVGKASHAGRPIGKHSFNPPRNRALIRVLRSGLTEEQANHWETFYIQHYGRRDDGTGILCNLTDGGEGTMGRIVDPETAKAGGVKGGKTQLENHRAWELYGVTKERWESLSVARRTALRLYMRDHPEASGNDWVDGNYTKWQSSEAGREHQLRANAIATANKKKAAAEKWGLSLEDYLKLDAKALSRMKAYCKRNNVTAYEWLKLDTEGLILRTGSEGHLKQAADKKRAAAERNGVAYDVWCAMKAWQRDNITTARKAGKNIKPLIDRYVA